MPRSPAEQTVLSVLRSGERWLRERGVEAPRRSMELLLAHVLGLPRLQLYLQFDRPLSSAELDALRALLVRRGAHEPIAYVLGEAAFHDVVLRTDARALVPRPETEGLVERAIACAGHGARVLDLGTGSGAIAVALAHARPDLTVVATDASVDALALARENVERHDLGARVELLHGAWWAPVAGRTFDVVVSNPPYVDPLRTDLIDPAVARYEPAAALFTPPGDPAAPYREICAGLEAGLVPGGTVLLETGVEAAEPALAVLRAQPFLEAARLEPDLAGLPRYLIARRA